MAAPAALSTVFPDRQGVNDILGEAGVKWRLDDGQSGAISAAEEAVLTRLYSLATAWVKQKLANYDLSDYPNGDIASHHLIYRWACIHATVQLCPRRGNPVPGSLQKMLDDATKTLDGIQAGRENLPDVAQTSSPSMSLSNVRLDDFYLTRKLRVETNTSDPIPARHDQAKDWISSTVPERPTI